MSSQFLKDAAERAAKTFAQTLLAYFGASALDVLHADWGNGLSVAAGAVVLSLLSSVVSLNLGNSGTASMTKAVEPAGRHAAP
jgi:hypothetical protein